jgi:hypothetical protein
LANLVLYTKPLGRTGGLGREAGEPGLYGFKPHTAPPAPGRRYLTTPGVYVTGKVSPLAGGRLSINATLSDVRSTSLARIRRLSTIESRLQSRLETQLEKLVKDKILAQAEKNKTLKKLIDVVHDALGAKDAFEAVSKILQHPSLNDLKNSALEAGKQFARNEIRSAIFEAIFGSYADYGPAILTLAEMEFYQPLASAATAFLTQRPDPALSDPTHAEFFLDVLLHIKGTTRQSPPDFQAGISPSQPGRQTGQPGPALVPEPSIGAVGIAGRASERGRVPKLATNTSSEADGLPQLQRLLRSGGRILRKNAYALSALSKTTVYAPPSNAGFVAYAYADYLGRLEGGDLAM